MDENGFGFRRKHDRKSYNTEIVFSHKDRVYSGTMKNISLGGAFVITSSVNQFSSGDIVMISIPFSTGKKHVKRKARIGWQNNEGFAVEFL